MKKALVTGITGQDGSYLAELLLGKGYEVWGLYEEARRSTREGSTTFMRDPHEGGKLRLVYGDLTDGGNLTSILNDMQWDEVYNLGARATCG